jgi:hypothetical protein
MTHHHHHPHEHHPHDVRVLSSPSFLRLSAAQRMFAAAAVAAVMWGAIFWAMG